MQVRRLAINFGKFDSYLRDPLRFNYSKMSKPTPEQIKSAFDSFDTDKSGDLSAQELQAGLANFNITITLEQAQDLHTKFDANKSGGLDFDEFQKIISHYFDN